MNRLFAAALAAGFTALAPAAFAQTLDGSIGYTAMDFDGFDVGAVTARLSWTSSGIFGVEGEASFGIDDDNIPLMGSPPPARDGVFELKHQVAIYGVAGVPLGENGRVFARVGYGSQKTEADLIIGKIEETEESVNYGIGAQFMFNERNGVRGDYTKFDFDRGGADTWSIGYVRRFN